MKPRIFINIHYLELGGAEMALIGLLQALDPDRVEVDLMLNAHTGALLKFVPQWVNILPEDPSYAVVEVPLVEALKKGKLGVVAGRIMARLAHRFYRLRHKLDKADDYSEFGYIGKFVNPWLPSLKHYGNYDLAISFLTPHNVTLDKVNAKKRVCWIHTDYSRTDINAKLEASVWGGYDYIVSISPEVGRVFAQVFPRLKDRLVEIENVISPEFIRSRAEEYADPQAYRPYKNELKLLTIGRFSYPKRMEEIPLIMDGLLRRGVDAHWFIIGFGPDEERAKIVNAIKQSGMEDRVHLVGRRSNPYPYIKYCDWYVQPSRYEGKSITVREAQILCKPVIVTDYPTAASQVAHLTDGVIVPMEVEACADAMAKAIKDINLKRDIEAYLQDHDYGNMAEAEKIYSLI